MIFGMTHILCVIGLMYMIQLTLVYILICENEIHRKKTAYYWCIPFLGVVVFVLMLPYYFWKFIQSFLKSIQKLD